MVPARSRTMAIYSMEVPVTIVREAKAADLPKKASPVFKRLLAARLLWWTKDASGLETMEDIGHLPADGGWAEIKAACVAIDPSCAKALS